jgi:hypothetical protein
MDLNFYSLGIHYNPWLYAITIQSADILSHNDTIITEK